MKAQLRGWIFEGSSITAIFATDEISGNDTSTECCIQITGNNVNSRITEVLSAYTACTAIYLFDDGTVSDISGLFSNNLKTSKYPNVKSLHFLSGFFQNPLSGLRIFQGIGVEEIHAEGLNMSGVTNLVDMFKYAGSKYINIRNWKFSNGYHAMSYVFSECSNLTSLDLSGWNIPMDTNMSFFFNKCPKLTSLDLSRWNTSGVTNMCAMFSGCSKLSSLDLSHFNTSKVTNMASMFNNCSSLTSLDVSGWKTSSVTNMADMFKNCSSLTSLDLSHFNTSMVTGMKSMFDGCSSLTSLDVSGFDTSIVDDARFMFDHCRKINTLKWNNWKLSVAISQMALTQESTKDLVSKLATVTSSQTLTLGSTLLSYLSEEEIALANSKGWTLA